MSREISSSSSPISPSHFAHHNFCRVHSTLHVTPAMAAGISSDAWSLDRLLSQNPN